MERNRGLDREPAAKGVDGRDRRAPGKPDAGAAARRSRRPTVLGAVVAASAVGAWLLRRERVRAPEGTWRDALLSDGPREAGSSGTSGTTIPPGPLGSGPPGTDER